MLPKAPELISPICITWIKRYWNTHSCQISFERSNEEERGWRNR